MSFVWLCWSTWWHINIFTGEKWETKLNNNNNNNPNFLKTLATPNYMRWGLELKLQYFGHLTWRAESLEKTPDDEKDWRQEEGAIEDEMIWWHQGIFSFITTPRLRIQSRHITLKFWASTTWCYTVYIKSKLCFCSQRVYLLLRRLD